MRLQFVYMVLVGIGGMAGCILRYLTGVLVWPYKGTGFPWATFWVNTSGCLAIGLMMGWIMRQPNWETGRLFLATGFCGGFTTFSAFSFECLQLLRQQQYALMSMYIAASLLACMLATALGFYITK